MHRIGKDRTERLEIVPAQLRIIINRTPEVCFLPVCRRRDPRVGIGDRINAILQDSLLRRMREPLQRGPAPTGPGPAVSCGDRSGFGQHRNPEEAVAPYRPPAQPLPSPNQIAHCLKRRVRNPHRYQFPGAR
ncbi:hypothetical protein FNJ84_21525 [Paracoccus sp. M683]|uniref:hypothetical protein n=1 Tax=Paracoccus sp. M683 TaxID=2594268 RepID=UPI00117C5E84|nr:hypothetical protein FNJ84_21525 [Paracoccus sp. M683]